MSRRVPAPPVQQELLDRLMLTFKDHRSGGSARRRAAPEHRAEAVRAAHAGVPMAAIAKAIGVTAWTLSRWIKASPASTRASTALPPPAMRELMLVATPRPVGPAEGSAAQVATLRLPSGLRLDVPVAALTAGFLELLLSVGGAT